MDSIIQQSEPISVPVRPPSSVSVDFNARPPSRPPSSQPPSRPRTPLNGPKCMELLEALIEELHCTLCLELFNEPRTLGCMHTFCADCLGTLVIPTFSPPKKENPQPGGRRGSVQSVLKTIECPLCRFAHELGPDGIHGLPRNPIICNMLDKYKVSMKKQMLSRAHSNNAAVDRSRIAAESGEQPTVLVNHMPFRTKADEVTKLVADWARNASWVPSGFSAGVRLADVTPVWVPFYEFEIECSTTYTSRLSFNLGPDRPSLSQSGAHTGSYRPVLCASTRSDFALWCSQSAKWDHDAMILTRIVIEVPKDAEVVWKRGGYAVVEAQEREACALLVRRQSRPDSIADLHCYTKILKMVPRLQCYPFYFCRYTFGGQSYRLLINGYTGDITADRPYGMTNIFKGFSLW